MPMAPTGVVSVSPVARHATSERMKDIPTYALELKRSKGLQNESFKVTPEMRQEVYQRLKAKGVEVTPAQFNAAGTLVD